MSNAKEEISKLKRSYLGRQCSRAFYVNVKGQKIFHNFLDYYLINSDEDELRLWKRAIEYNRLKKIAYLPCVLYSLASPFFLINGEMVKFWVGLFVLIVCGAAWSSSKYKKIIAEEVKRLTPASREQLFTKEDVLPLLKKMNSNAVLIVSFFVFLYFAWDAGQGAPGEPFPILKIIFFIFYLIFIGYLIVLKNENWF